MRQSEKKLLGKWVSEPSGSEIRESYEDTTLEFKEGGWLDYTIHGAEKDQKLFLTYRVEDNILITDQPSHPREERTPFMFAEDGRLVFVYEDQRYLYVRV